jgi:plastocyanin
LVHLSQPERRGKADRYTLHLVPDLHQSQSPDPVPNMTRNIPAVLISFALTAVIALAQTPKATVAAVPSDSIAGKILYTGPPPVLKHHSLNSEPDCEKKHPDGIMSQEVAVNSNHTLQNVLIYVKDGLPNKQYPTPATPVKVDQSGCMFLPHVVAVMINQPVQFLDSDNASHNVHAMPKLNRDWNVAQDRGSSEVTKFPKFEIGMPVRCNIHRWMQMYINVLSNPFYAVTGKDGSYVIKGLPPGEYTIEVWQEKFGTQMLKVKTGTRADFTYKG